MVQCQWESGTKFGLLTTTGKSYKDKRSLLYIEVICECNVIKFIRASSILTGNCKSCGCLRKQKKLSEVETERRYLYKIYKDILRRCYDQKSKDFKNYGGRATAIAVCEEWRNEFNLFYKWAKSNGWFFGCGLTIDRIENNGNYEPSNCRWASDYTQRRNKRNNIFLSAFGETKILSDWGRDFRCVVSFKTFKARIKYGWAPERALTSLLYK